MSTYQRLTPHAQQLVDQFTFEATKPAHTGKGMAFTVKFVVNKSAIYLSDANNPDNPQTQEPFQEAGATHATSVIQALIERAQEIAVFKQDHE
jgi:hypothetical protein